MDPSGVCNSPSTAFGGGFGHGVSGKCREKCKCISRKVAGGGDYSSRKGEGGGGRGVAGDSDMACPGSVGKSANASVEKWREARSIQAEGERGRRTGSVRGPR